MLSLDFNTLSTPDRQRWLQNAIVPRPIAFVSSISVTGISNIAPFSFFNVMSSNPPLLVFSPALSGKTGAAKDTLINLKEIPECVVNLVHYDIIQACSLSSSPYAPEISEFDKSGLTPLRSIAVKPFRIAESKIQFECRITNIVELGTSGGAGNLVLAEVLHMHVDDALLNADQKLNPFALDLVARAGDNWYYRMIPDGFFEITKPISELGIGYDQLPDFIKNNQVLNANIKSFLASISTIPNNKTVDEYIKLNQIPDNQNDIIIRLNHLMKQNNCLEAWCLLLAFDNYYNKTT